MQIFLFSVKELSILHDAKERHVLLHYEWYRSLLLVSPHAQVCLQDGNSSDLHNSQVDRTTSVYYKYDWEVLSKWILQYMSIYLDPFFCKLFFLLLSCLGQVFAGFIYINTLILNVGVFKFDIFLSLFAGFGENPPCNELKRILSPRYYLSKVSAYVYLRQIAESH